MAEIEAGAKKKRKGLPTGITIHRTQRHQARLTYKDDNNKTKQRFIPGLFTTVEEAVTAQAAAQAKLDTEGSKAVWPASPVDRNKRGEVRRALPSCSALATLQLHLHAGLKESTARQGEQD